MKPDDLFIFFMGIMDDDNLYVSQREKIANKNNVVWNVIVWVFFIAILILLLFS
jgi:hypothetical protein